MIPFSLQQVTMLDAYHQNALRREVDYLLTFETGKLLAGFRETAGLSTEGYTRYGGWESHLIGGHTLGHYLTACAQAYANSGVNEADKTRLLAILRELVDGLRVCQQHSKGKPGFLFGAPIRDAANVEKQFDYVEERRTNIFTESWVPWYTLHKLLAGLNDTYIFTGYAPALEVAEALGEWTYARASGWSESLRLTVLSTEYGGMNDCLYTLYALTGNERIAEAAHLFDENALFEKVLAGGPNVLTNRHANTTIPKFMGALNRYAVMHGRTAGGETVDASRYLRYAEAFFDMVVEHHTYITGGNSEWEHFGEDDVLDAERTNCNNETCNIYNMLKMARLLYSLTGHPRFLAFYENAYLNSILGSQNPETGMTTYFQPMASGYFKVYGTPHGSFWCCTGSGMENFTKLGDTVYYHGENEVLTALYLTSRLEWAEKGLTLEQVSRLPEEGLSTFSVKLVSGTIDLLFRVPEWADGFAVTLNGSPVTAPVENGLLRVTGVKDGDSLTASMPMRLTAHPLPDNRASVAFKYGPYVLSADMGTDAMDTAYTGVDVLIPAIQSAQSSAVALPDGKSLDDLLTDPEAFFDKQDGAVFRLKDTDFVFSPHYLRYRERYAIYLLFLTPEQKREWNSKHHHQPETVLDTVQPGYGQYESDELHAMAEVNTAAVTDDGTYRYAREGGSFTYRMLVNKSGSTCLQFTLRAADNGKTLCIASGPNQIYAETLDYHGTEPAYTVRAMIHDSLCAQARTIEANGTSCDILPITFSGLNGAASARVCDFIKTVHLTPVEGDA